MLDNPDPGTVCIGPSICTAMQVRLPGVQQHQFCGQTSGTNATHETTTTSAAARKTASSVTQDTAETKQGGLKLISCNPRDVFTHGRVGGALVSSGTTMQVQVE